MEQDSHLDIQQGLQSQTANDLFDYDVGLDELLQRAPTASSINAPTGDSGLGLGLDEEVKVMRREWIEEEKPRARMDDTGQDLQADGSSLPVAVTTKSHHAVDAHVFSSHSVGHGKIDKELSTEQSDVPAQGLFMPHDSNNHRAITRDVPEDGDELEILLREQQCDEATAKSLSTFTDLDADLDGMEAMEEFNILTPT
ncbi:unnamed protein product [Aspergillus oryzae]|uniref:Unnamed protein product n=2 Tax=Aspergillus oryzae TaxID=5062 RepID=A0AAN5BXG7_ASPOZ|nr:unnamed protein product [Aspergillus oryzae]GMF94153.1 unnamed protein product [Aspergillus oryzae]GMG10222.1 unnamed protein product [Aspergillus oryzae]GMG30600.1 unnamed protein product [Aspergillus oryzae]GMG52006.1 unnamed protein product [Aspergillus oryzae var. brunneus]